MAETPETQLVDTAEQQAQCNRCGRFTEWSAGRQRSAQWWCHTCFALEKAVARNMGGFPEEFTPDDKAEFFQRAAQASTGGVKWTVVRALLTEQLTIRREEESASSVQATFKPLEVWVKEGYCEDKVKQCPTEQHPHLGTTYGVALRTMTRTEREKAAYEYVLRREQEASRKKGKKTAEEEPDKTWVLPEDRPGAKATSQGQAERKQLRRRPPGGRKRTSRSRPWQLKAWP